MLVNITSTIQTNNFTYMENWIMRIQFLMVTPGTKKKVSYKRKRKKEEILHSQYDSYSGYIIFVYIMPFCVYTSSPVSSSLQGIVPMKLKIV